MTAYIDSPTLKAWLSDGRELALLDVREHGQFGEGHLFFAMPLPYSRFELGLPALLPNPAVRLVLCDGGDGIAERAAAACRGPGLPQRPRPRRRRAGVAARGLHALCRRQRAEQDLRRADRARKAHAARDCAGGPGHARRRREFRHRRRPPARRIRQDEHPRRHLLPERRAGAAHRRHRPRPGDQDRRQLRRPHALHHRRADADRLRHRQSGLRAGERHAGLVPRRPRARARRDRRYGDTPIVAAPDRRAGGPRAQSGSARTRWSSSRPARPTPGSRTPRARPTSSTCARPRSLPHTPCRASRTRRAAS